MQMIGRSSGRSFLPFPECRESARRDMEERVRTFVFSSRTSFRHELDERLDKALV